MYTTWSHTLCRRSLRRRTRIDIIPCEKVRPDSYWNALKHGGSIPVMDSVTGFSRFRQRPTGACESRQPNTVTGFVYRVLRIFLRVPARNGQFPEGFSGKFTKYCFRNHRPGMGQRRTTRQAYSYYREWEFPNTTDTI